MDNTPHNRLGVHEAGHAVVHFACGRPIVHAVVVPEAKLHQVDPVPGQSMSMVDEAMGLAAGWAAEERLLILNGVTRDDELTTEHMNGGSHVDEAHLAALASEFDEVDVEVEEARAAAFVERYWSFIAGVARELVARRIVLQGDLERIAEVYGVTFGEAASSPADSVRTGDA